MVFHFPVTKLPFWLIQFTTFRIHTQYRKKRAKKRTRKYTISPRFSLLVIASNVIPSQSSALLGASRFPGWHSSLEFISSLVLHQTPTHTPTHTNVRSAALLLARRLWVSFQLVFPFVRHHQLAASPSHHVPQHAQGAGAARSLQWRWMHFPSPLPVRFRSWMGFYVDLWWSGCERFCRFFLLLLLLYVYLPLCSSPWHWHT